MADRAVAFGGPPPVWTAPVEVVRRLAPPDIQERLVWLRARGVVFRPHAQLSTALGGVVAEIAFTAPTSDGVVALRFQTGVRLEENA